MDELGLVDWIVARARVAGGPVKLGPGDDCAVLAGTGTDDIHFTIDEVVEGTLFRLSGAGRGPRATGQDVGYKALAASVSDLAAMGAEPIAAVAAAALRKGQAASLGKAVYLGLERAGQDAGCPLVGGNLAETRGPVSVSVAAIGRTPKDGGFLRSGARPGDVLFVTGELGGSILGRHLKPVPRFAEARELRRLGGVRAMMDVSDGLALDLTRLARSSGTGAVIESARVPVSRAAAKLAAMTGRSALDHALSDGEDYELLCAVEPGAAERMERKWRLATRLTRIGTILPQSEGLLLVRAGRAVHLKDEGFRHL